MKSIANKIVWITGASSGIGEALAYSIAKAGARLIISARDVEKLLLMQKKCGSQNVQILPLDLESGSLIAKKVTTAISMFNGLDILINNAGISQRSQANETEFQVYRRIMEVNYFGTVALTQQVLIFFHEQNRGTVAVISSVAGITGLPYRTAYCSSKYALEGYMASLRTELWKTNIKLLIIRPGAVNTSIAKHALTGEGKPFNKSDNMIEKGMEPAFVAEKIVDAIATGKKELMIGSFKERSMFIINRLFPKIVFNTAKKIKY